jgi:hypothetical protein
MYANLLKPEVHPNNTPKVRSSKEDEMGRACSTIGGEEECI